MPPPPPSRPPPRAPAAPVPSSKPPWDDRPMQPANRPSASVFPPTKPLPPRPTANVSGGVGISPSSAYSAVGPDATGSSASAGNGSSSRPSSSSSTGGGRSSRPSSSESKRMASDPPYMPWLLRDTKGAVDLTPPFSHRHDARPASKEERKKTPAGPPPSRPVPQAPAGPPPQYLQREAASASAPTISVGNLATRHLERHMSMRGYTVRKGGGDEKDDEKDATDDIKGSDPRVIEAREEKAEGKIGDDPEENDDVDFDMAPLELDIANINGEDDSRNHRNADSNSDSSYRLHESSIHIGSDIEIRSTGLSTGVSSSSASASSSSSVPSSRRGPSTSSRYQPPPPSVPPPARDVFVPLSLLGRGATGLVRKALHVPSLTLVAMKEISVLSDDGRAAMVREVKALHSNLKPLSAAGPATTAAPPSASGLDAGSPHILTLYDAFMDSRDQTVTLVVEYMDGGSLQDIVDTGGCDSEPVLANISARVLSGLAALHASNRIHRDIKPANLLINHRGDVKISDLGLARLLEPGAGGAAETFAGTYTYMSPERIGGQKYSYTSDVWGLGLTVLTVAVGRFPFEEAAEGGYWALLQALKDGKAPTLDELSGEGVFSATFQDFIDKCLIKDPRKRPSAAELLKHPFVRDVDVTSEPADNGEEGDGDVEGEGSDTARTELEDIVGAVVDYYRALWQRQSEEDISLTVPNFNKGKLRNLGRQIGLNLGMIQRKMKGVLKRLKSDLEGLGFRSARGEGKSEGEGSFLTLPSSGAGRSFGEGGGYASARAEAK